MSFRKLPGMQRSKKIRTITKRIIDQQKEIQPRGRRRGLQYLIHTLHVLTKTGDRKSTTERDGDTGQSPFRLQEVKTVMSESRWGRE